MEKEKQPHITVSITKEQLSRLPMANYLGNIVVVDRVEDAEAAITDLRDSDIIGFDTETRPSFKKGVINKVALMQLSTRKCCYLFRLNRIGVPDTLRDLLEDESKLKVGLSIHDDFHNIRNVCGSFNPAGFIDLQPFVKKYSIADNSLARIYGILFGQRISKGQRLTNWEADELTVSQRNYAALDAIACIQIYDWITQGKFIPELSPYMHPEQESEREERERREEKERKKAEALLNPPAPKEILDKSPAAEAKRRRRRNARIRRKAALRAKKAAAKAANDMEPGNSNPSLPTQP